MTRKKKPQDDRDQPTEAQQWLTYINYLNNVNDEDYLNDEAAREEHEAHEERELRQTGEWLHDARSVAQVKAIWAFVEESEIVDAKPIAKAFEQLTGCDIDREPSPEALQAFAVFRDAVVATRMLSSRNEVDAVTMIDALRHGHDFVHVQRRRLLRLVMVAAKHVAHSPWVVGAFIRRASAIWPGFARLDPKVVELALLEYDPNTKGHATAARISASVHGFGADHEKHIDNAKRNFKSAEEDGRKKVLKRAPRR